LQERFDMLRMALFGLVVTWCVSLSRILRNGRTPAPVRTRIRGRRSLA
jgi:hypothetical protein